VKGEGEALVLEGEAPLMSGEPDVAQTNTIDISSVPVA
jgi:hypothetical protein